MSINTGQMFAQENEQVIHQMKIPYRGYSEAGPSYKPAERTLYIFKSDYGYCSLKIGTGAMLYNKNGYDLHLDNMTYPNEDKFYIFKDDDNEFQGDLCFLRTEKELYALFIYRKEIPNHVLRAVIMQHGVKFLNQLELALYSRINIIED